MIEQIQQTLIKDCQIDLNRPLLVGVSGGPDSLFLLDNLNRLGFSIVVGHLDHGLREESASEAEAVKAFTRASGLPSIIESADVHGYALQKQISIETAARQVRYEFLFRQAAAFQAQAVAVAHNADDQVETFLLHLLRGTGLDGMKGMPYYSLPNPWSKTIPLIRPLLNIWRRDILQYLEDRHITPHWDATNLDTAYLRNRVRHELIPNLETYNPRIRQSLWRTAQILQQEDQEIQLVAQNAWQACFCQQGNGYLVLDLAKTAALPIAVRRRVIRIALSQLLPGLPDIEFAHVERINQFLDQPSRSAGSDIAAGVRIFQEKNTLWFATQEANLSPDRYPQMAVEEIQTIQVPGEIHISAGWSIKAEVLPGSAQNLALAQANQDKMQAWLDFEKISLPLAVRCRRSGDRFQPLGMKEGSAKISDILINHKISKRARASYPFVVDSQSIVWAPGIQMSEKYRLSAESKTILHLEIRKILGGE